MLQDCSCATSTFNSSSSGSHFRPFPLPCLTTTHQAILPSFSLLLFCSFAIKLLFISSPLSSLEDGSISISISIAFAFSLPRCIASASPLSLHFSASFFSSSLRPSFVHVNSQQRQSIFNFRSHLTHSQADVPIEFSPSSFTPLLIRLVFSSFSD